jgi:hypothetical protein
MKTFLASPPSPLLRVILPGGGSLFAFVIMMLLAHLA